ncbi:hypothetical protein ACFL6D_03685 [Spirochaetota bacterium]
MEKKYWFLFVISIFIFSCSRYQSSKLFVEKTDTDKVQNQVNVIMFKAFKSLKYDDLLAFYVPGLGAVVTGGYRGKTIPESFPKNLLPHTDKDVNKKEFIKDFEANNRYACAIAAEEEVPPAEKIIISLRTESGKQLRSWRKSYCVGYCKSTDAAIAEDDTDIEKYFYLLNGVNSRAGKYPNWNEIETAEMDILKILNTVYRSYLYSFFMPGYGFVYAVEAQKIDKAVIKKAVYRASEIGPKLKFQVQNIIFYFFKGNEGETLLIHSLVKGTEKEIYYKYQK